MSALLELAERCEAQNAGEWAEIGELFEDAFRECFPKPERIWVTDNTGNWTEEYSQWQARQYDFYELVEAHAFLDAAMTLVPKGMGWSIGFGIVPGVGEGPQFFSGLQVGPDMQVCAGYAMPALTLCAVALKARAASVGRNGNRQDRETGLGPKGEHAVGKAETPKA